MGSASDTMPRGGLVSQCHMTDNAHGVCRNLGQEKGKGMRNWTEVVDEDLPASCPITQRTREMTKEYSGRFRGSVRVSTGRFWTDQEYEEYRKRILSTPLP